MRYFGYSTGAIAKNDVNAAMDCLRDTMATAIEVSALRLHELEDALDFVVNRDSKRFSYVSFHAPSRFTAEEEDMVLRSLAVVAERKWPIVAHPDMIHTPARWRAFGSLLLIENMDQRKPIGRTADELDPVFAALPEAGLCFDLGHAKQVDPSMTEAYRILHRHGRRLKQIHLSDVDNDSRHHPLNIPALNDFFRVAPFVNRGSAVILEAVVPRAEVNTQLLMAQFFFAAADAHRWIKLQSKPNATHREWFANTSQILVNGTDANQARIMQAYAEGFEIFRNADSELLDESLRYDLNIADIAEVWRRGSVVGSWLLDLSAMALAEDPELKHFSGYVYDSGEGRWTIQAAIEEAVPAEVLSAALYTRFRSRQNSPFGEKLLSAMRNKFGGHIEQKPVESAVGASKPSR